MKFSIVRVGERLALQARSVWAAWRSTIRMAARLGLSHRISLLKSFFIPAFSFYYLYWGHLQQRWV
jgi:hypothetical protein